MLEGRRRNKLSMDILGEVQSQSCRRYRICGGRKSIEWTAANMGGRGHTVRPGRVDCARSKQLANFQHAECLLGQLAGSVRPAVEFSTAHHAMRCGTARRRQSPIVGPNQRWPVAQHVGDVVRTDLGKLGKSVSAQPRRDERCCRWPTEGRQCADFCCEPPQRERFGPDYDLASNQEQSECQPTGLDALDEHGHRASITASAPKTHEGF